MINFVVPNSIYNKVVLSFVEPIIPHVKQYSINNTAINNAINVIFFTENNYFNKHCKSLKNTKNVFITHGIADKNWRNAQKTAKFDYVFVSGDLWVDKLTKEGMCENKIKLGGYTRLDNIYNQKDTYVKTFDNGKKTILFAPTHNSTRATSYNKLNDIIDSLKSQYNIIVSEHPANREDKSVTSNQFLEADVVVGDFGSSMYEAWTLGKPSVLPSWFMRDVIGSTFPSSFEDYIYKNSIGYHANSPTEFVNLIEKACNEGITKREVDFIDGIFNKDLRGCGGKATGDILLEIEKELL